MEFFRPAMLWAIESPVEAVVQRSAEIGNMVTQALEILAAVLPRLVVSKPWLVVGGIPEEGSGEAAVVGSRSSEVCVIRINM